METIRRRFNGGNFVTRYLHFLLTDLLPRRFKRLVYVSTALGLILREKNPDLGLMTKMNEVMHLAHKEASMIPLLYISAMVWKSVSSNVIQLSTGASVALNHLEYKDLSEKDCWDTAHLLARKSPDWLQYGSLELMVHDVYQMLQCLKKAA